MNATNLYLNGIRQYIFWLNSERWELKQKTKLLKLNNISLPLLRLKYLKDIYSKIYSTEDELIYSNEDILCIFIVAQKIRFNTHEKFLCMFSLRIIAA